MKEDSDFLKKNNNNILACVDSYECLFTWCTVYIQKVFLLQRLLSTMQRFGTPSCPPP